MLRLKRWQWVATIAPIAAIVLFLLVAAGWQIQAWGISWIWAIFTLLFVGWRWLLAKWTRSEIAQVEEAFSAVNQELHSITDNQAVQLPGDEATQQAEIALQRLLQEAQTDRPIWEDLQTFLTRCQGLIAAIAHIYHPDAKYPLLNIYVPQAYGLLRGTMDDLDHWMQKISPALNRVTVGQAYQAYEVYQKLEPSARKLWQTWGWAQWLFNPAAAAARTASRHYNERANQQLLVNLSQMFREAALRNLCRQAIALYSGNSSGNLPALSPIPSPPTLPKAETQTLRDLLAKAEPPSAVEQKPVHILLVGRTGAGKSSLINTLFQAELAAVDVLPSTDRLNSYRWQAETGETLTLWDSPGYEQANRADLRSQVLDCAHQADLLLLVTPALDPALQMDVDFLRQIQTTVADLPAIAIVSQVDRLRPIREWEPPYDWEWGGRSKEVAIREATEYRAQQLEEFCQRILPVVTGDVSRGAWGTDELSLALVEAIAPAKQLRLARFLRHLESRTAAAAQIIDRYTFQMATAQGVTALLKSPVLQFISTLATGQPTLAYILAQKIPVEQLPVVVGKLQMAYDLFSLLHPESNPLQFDLLAIWPLLLENSTAPARQAWALGHALVEYWTQNLTNKQLLERFEGYLKSS
jgi:predicted GTPase